MGVWSFSDANPPELTCMMKPTCLFCGAKLGVTNATLYKVQMSGQCNPDPQGRAIDVMMRCPACGYVEGFGVALSQNEAKQIYG